VIEDFMRDVMFEVPSRTDVREVVVTADCIDKSVPPLLVLHPETQKKEA
jgi:ATP-dependent protease Clp ATPase subunit